MNELFDFRTLLTRCGAFEPLEEHRLVTINFSAICHSIIENQEAPQRQKKAFLLAVQCIQGVNDFITLCGHRVIIEEDIEEEIDCVLCVVLDELRKKGLLTRWQWQEIGSRMPHGSPPWIFAQLVNSRSISNRLVRDPSTGTVDGFLTYVHNMVTTHLEDLRKRKLPDTPGVYFFLGKRRKNGVRGRSRIGASAVRGRRVLYIGKAGSLRDRVRSYLGKDIIFTRSPVIEKMVKEVEDIYFQKTDSVLEALILEAELIKKYKPKYNVREKDDKSFNYVVITDEDFPRVLLIRGRELKLNGKKLKLKAQYGPFPQGGVLKEALSIARKIFPFRDKCTPIQHSYKFACPAGCVSSRSGENVRVLHSTIGERRGKMGQQRERGIGKSCFNRQIGLCPGVCTGEISKREYQRIIRNIKLLFEGKKSSLVASLTREMREAAKRKNFEHAAEVRNTTFALDHIQDIALLKDDFLSHEPASRQTRLPRLAVASRSHEPADIRRIEGYDVAHMSGKEIVGAMVVLDAGVPKKSAYRKFKLRTIDTSNDPGALKEILERRLRHPEWVLPDLIVVDGGKAQVNAARRVLGGEKIFIPVVGVVKDERHKPKKIIGDKAIVHTQERNILLANAEAHRFAIRFHREKRDKMR